MTLTPRQKQGIAGIIMGLIIVGLVLWGLYIYSHPKIQYNNESFNEANSMTCDILEN